MTDLLIKFPSRTRPNLFKQKLDACINLLSGELNIKFIFSFDSDDASMNNDDIKNYLQNKNINMNYYYGESKNKIHAFNRDIPQDDWKILLVMSDDMLAISKNYDKIIYDDMIKYFPNFDGCLNYNTHNEAWKNRAMVLPLMGRNFYNKFGYVYYPEYKSLYCDIEQTEIAISLNKLIDVDKKIISHEWSSVRDDLRKYTESNELRNHDFKIYEHRKANGYFL